MHLVIVGNGSAGSTAARHVRKLDASARITVVSDESDHPYSRTALMYLYMGDLQFAHTKLYEDGFWTKNRIDLVRDRVLAVDAQGRVVDGDYILYFWGKRLRDAGRLPQDTIISTVMANLGFERAWQKQGGTLVRTKVGDQHVHAEMVNQGAMLGGEQSGHILCHHYSLTGDGILTALHLAELRKQAECSLPYLVAQCF